MTNPSPPIVRSRLLPVTVNAAAKLGLAGSITVTKRNRAGELTPVRVDRNRRAFQNVWEHTQSNLITNAGLDGIAAAEGFAPLLSYVAVGTGSTAPDVTDAALDNEVARTNANLGLGADTYEHVAAGQQRFTRVVAFNFAEANGNLTEFGGFRAAGAGDAQTRDLFRDGSGDPVPITKTSDEQLVISYGMDLSYGPTVLTPAGTINIAGYGTFELEHMFYRAYGNIVNHASRAFVSTFQNARVAALTSFSGAYDQQNAGSIFSGRGQSPLTTTTPGSGQVLLGYVPGSYERVYRTQLTAGASDDSFAGFALFRYGASSDRFTICGWRFADPTSLLHDRDYRLQLNAKLQWGRA